MKIHFFVILLWGIASAVWPSAGCAAQQEDAKIEQFPTGCINWTIGACEAKGVSTVQGRHPVAEERDKALAAARRQAAQNIFLTVRQLRVDTFHTVEDIINQDAAKRTKVLEMASAASVVRQEDLDDGVVRVTLRLDLRGGFAQFMLPAEVKQVEAIKALPSHGAPKTSADVKSEVFSGLVVDARGIGMRPTMVPILLDEDGKELYSPTFVSREYAVQQGISGYTRSTDQALSLERVSPRPLQIKGLRTASGTDSRIVVSNADAAKLRSASDHLAFLRRCRVVIVVD